MGRIDRSTLVECRPHHVFGVLGEVERLTVFSGWTVEVMGPGRPPRADDTFEQIIKILGKELETTWTLVDVEPDSLLRFEGAGVGGARATLIARLTVDGAGTRVEMDVDDDLPLGILGDAVDAVCLHSKHEEQAEEIRATLKAICESST
jgi:hypothetical protein